MIQRQPNANDVIAALNLEPYVEGGYYRRAFQADDRDWLQMPGCPCYLLTSIYFLLTEDSPVGQFHFNQSDILHYFHRGDAIEYNRSLQTLVMGSDVLAGQQFQMHVPGRIWKASRLLEGSNGFGLINVAVSPGLNSRIWKSEIAQN
ncbi:putative cupin superfamily sugar epimerase [Pseudomonas sp. EB276 TE3739]|nr:putative cupin superfamily sugar epimerase [Pseudomonas koreensis]